MIFGAAQKMKKSEKIGEDVKRGSPPVRSAEEVCSPKSFWSLQSQAESCRVCN